MMRVQAIAVAAVLCFAASASGFVVDGDQNLQGGATLNSSPAGDDVVPTATAGGWKYDLTDKNGTGTPGAATVASPGLSLGSDTIDNFVFGHAGYPTANTNDADLEFDLAGGDLTGDSGSVAFDTHTGYLYGTDYPSGSVIVRNVGNVYIGEVDLYTVTNQAGTTSNGPAGEFVIGEDVDGKRALDVRIDSIDTYVTKNGRGGNVSIYGTVDVLIQTDAGTPVVGSIDAHGPKGGGDVEIKHDGSFVVNEVNTRNSGAYVQNGNQTFNGDVNGDGADGTFKATSLYAYSTHSFDRYGGDVTISGYLTVDVGDINVSTDGYNGGGSHFYAGTVLITAEGDINITGAFDAHSHYDSTDARTGEMELTTTGGNGDNGGRITVAALDGELFEYVSFNSYTGESLVEGELLNIDTDDATVTKLTAAAGQVVWYRSHGDPTDPVAANQYLFDNDTFDGTQDGIWTLSGGGVLAPMAVPEPATLALLAVGGLAVAAGRGRRRR